VVERRLLVGRCVKNQPGDASFLWVPHGSSCFFLEKYNEEKTLNEFGRGHRFRKEG
jgi:hypothetical protein